MPFGGLGRIRTYDLRFRKPTFYPLNYETLLNSSIIKITYTNYKINKGEAISAIGTTAIIEAAYSEGVIGIAT